MENKREENEKDSEYDPSPCGNLSHLRRSFRPPLFVGFPEGYEVFYAPKPICYASGHCWTCPKRAVNLDEIVRDASSLKIQRSPLPPADVFDTLSVALLPSNLQPQAPASNSVVPVV